MQVRSFCATEKIKQLYNTAEYVNLLLKAIAMSTEDIRQRWESHKYLSNDENIYLKDFQEREYRFYRREIIKKEKIGNMYIFIRIDIILLLILPQE